MWWFQVFDGGYYEIIVSDDKTIGRGISIISLAYLLSKRPTLHSQVDYTSYKDTAVNTLTRWARPVRHQPLPVSTCCSGLTPKYA